MTDQIIKNWVTIPRVRVDEALVWAKSFGEYITNDYAVIGGRIDHYQNGNDYDNFDFFFQPSKIMTEFELKFRVEE